MRSVHSDGYKAVLRVLTAARKRAGVSQQELARRLGKAQSFVSKYENGERRIDVAEFIAILAALDSDPQDGFAAVLDAVPFRQRPKARARRPKVM